MPAAYWKIRIDQGETWRMVLRLRDPNGPIDLTGYTARMQIRSTMASPEPLFGLTSSLGGGITIIEATGTMTLLIADVVTAAWQWTYGLYDLEIESPSGETTRLLKGEIEVSAEVTR